MKSWLMAAVLAAASFPALAATMTIDDLTPGTTVHGPETGLKDMKGKVVYVEIWGTR